MINTSEIREKIQRAHREAGSSPWLYGYDVVGIQDFIVARGRPIAMRGASQILIDFDDESGMNIFSKGGRGIGLTAGDEIAVQKRCDALTDKYRAKGGILATAAVPYRPDKVGECLAWLRAKLELAKDAAGPSCDPLPINKQSQCATCFRHLAVRTVQREEDATSQEQICERCYAAVERGRAIPDKQMSRSLMGLSKSEIIAAVSADGNGMGGFFDSLGSLEQLAAASEAVSKIFSDAHNAAMTKLRQFAVPLVTGGDDIRAFLAIEDLLAYVETLTRSVEAAAERAGNLGGILSTVSAERLRQLGVGVGAVVARADFPAAMLMDYAHQLEDSAKLICRPDHKSNRTRQARSAFDFEVLTSANAFSEGRPKRTDFDGRPFAMDTTWDKALQIARALKEIPSAQLGILSEERNMSQPEFLNLFRYQVARSSQWQGFYAACNPEWRDVAILDQYRPRTGHLALRRILDK